VRRGAWIQIAGPLSALFIGAYFRVRFRLGCLRHSLGRLP